MLAINSCFVHPKLLRALLLSLPTHQTNFCESCFDEVCSRCSTARHGVGILNEVRTDRKQACLRRATPWRYRPLSGTTVANPMLDKGYYRISNKSLEIRQCRNKEVCQGSNDTENYCTSGYTGACKKALACWILQNYHMLGYAWRKSRKQLCLALLRLLAYPFLSRYTFFPVWACLIIEYQVSMYHV